MGPGRDGDGMRTPRDGQAYSHTTGERLSYEDQARRLILLASFETGRWRRRRLIREAEVFALLSYATTERDEPIPREYTVPDMTAPAESLFDALVKHARNENVLEQVTLGCTTASWGRWDTRQSVTPYLHPTSPALTGSGWSAT